MCDNNFLLTLTLKINGENFFPSYFISRDDVYKTNRHWTTVTARLIVGMDSPKYAHAAGVSEIMPKTIAFSWDAKDRAGILTMHILSPLSTTGQYSTRGVHKVTSIRKVLMLLLDKYPSVVYANLYKVNKETTYDLY